MIATTPTATPPPMSTRLRIFDLRCSAAAAASSWALRRRSASRRARCSARVGSRGVVVSGSW